MMVGVIRQLETHQTCNRAQVVPYVPPADRRPRNACLTVVLEIAEHFHPNAGHGHRSKRARHGEPTADGVYNRLIDYLYQQDLPVPMFVVPAAEPALLEGVAFCLERNAHDFIDGFRRVAIYRRAGRCGADVDRRRYVNVAVDEVLHIPHVIKQGERGLASNREGEYTE